MNKQELDKTIENIMYLEDGPRKDLPKISIIIAIIGIVAIVSVFYYSNREESGVAGREDIKITKQENFYGLSGRVLDVRNNSIVISTVALPFGDYNPTLDDHWIWTVLIDDNTEVFNFTVNEQALEEDGDHLDLSISSKKNLKVGDFVTVTSSNDISTQFALADKFMTAIKIEVY